jgi:chemotaxis protein CheD
MRARPDALEIFLQPGDHYVGGADTRMRTLLGSCVSIVLWHQRRSVGAMTHFLLARRDRPASQALDGRYGDEALALATRELAAMQCDVRECEAKVFGGGSMFPGLTRTASLEVGRQNGEAARALLKARGINVVSECLYGNGHRQIVFDVDTGDVWVRKGRAPAPDWMEDAA